MEIIEPVFHQDAYLTECESELRAVECQPDGSCHLRVTHSVFYPTAGGQEGDDGVMLINGKEIPIVTVIKHDAMPCHVTAADVACEELQKSIGQEVTLRLNWHTRHRKMRLHSCMHLLCAAVKAPVTGGRITADKAHLDFDIDGAPPDKQMLTDRLNGWIAEDEAIVSRLEDASVLEQNPALVHTRAAAPPCIGGKVRLVAIGDIDIQACGGTHVRSTGEIGRVWVKKIENKGRQNRRIQIMLEE